MPAVDADSLAVVASATSRTAVGTYTLTRRNVRRIPFQFYRGGSIIQLSEDASGQLLLKKKDSPTGAALARALTWTREGSSSNSIYYFELSLLTDEAEALFAVTGAAEEPLVITDLILELNFIDSSRPQTPIKIAAELRNRYLQSDEDSPTPADPDMPPAADILIKTAQTLTDPEKQQVLANLGLTAAWLASLDCSAFPTADPGSGRIWLNGGVMQVGA